MISGVQEIQALNIQFRQYDPYQHKAESRVLKNFPEHKIIRKSQTKPFPLEVHAQNITSQIIIFRLYQPRKNIPDNSVIESSKNFWQLNFYHIKKCIMTSNINQQKGLDNSKNGRHIRTTSPHFVSA